MRYANALASRCKTWRALVLAGLCSCALALPQLASPVSAEPAASPAPQKPISSFADLLARFGKLSGMTARFHEEKRIALLKRPLQSEGKIAFAAPSSLLRQVERPEPSAMLLQGDQLRVADASGTRSIDLQSQATVRQLVLTFVQVLSGDRVALEHAYAPRFEALDSEGGWRLTLTPTKPELARLIKRATLQGKQLVVESLTLEEASGDTSVMRFSEVNTNARFDAAERARVFRLPGG